VSKQEKKPSRKYQAIRKPDERLASAKQTVVNIISCTTPLQTISRNLSMLHSYGVLPTHGQTDKTYNCAIHDDADAGSPSNAATENTKQIKLVTE
jgi:hypothetical protein